MRHCRRKPCTPVTANRGSGYGDGATIRRATKNCRTESTTRKRRRSTTATLYCRSAAPPSPGACCTHSDIASRAGDVDCIRTATGSTVGSRAPAPPLPPVAFAVFVESPFGRMIALAAPPVPPSTPGAAPSAPGVPKTLRVIACAGSEHAAKHTLG